MFLDIIALFVSFLCLVVSVMIIRSYQFDKNINVPFFIIILLVGLQRFQSALTNLNVVKLTSPFESFPFLALVFIPIFLFFFKISAQENDTSYKDLVHFIIPLFIIIIKKNELLSVLGSRLIFFSFSLIYWVLIFRIIMRYFKKTLSRNSFNRVNFRWLILVFVNTTLILFFLNYQALYWDLNRSDLSLTNFYRGSSIAWIVALMYLILNPVIVFGKSYLLNQLTIKSKLVNPWSFKPYKKFENKDMRLSQKINKAVPELIFALRVLEYDYDFLIKKEVFFKTLAKKLKIPDSHLKFLFKYYCELSIHEYLNFLKISLSIELIHQDFLLDRTIDSLSKTCFFESRITFYKNFKKFTGTTPSEFA